jgi:hydroxymethylpyrimidine/phosphomethylpyrimidine kinase
MQSSPVSPPLALTVAGSDCSAGAGLQADLKTFSAFGVYGLSVVTGIVAEVPGRVSRIVPVEPGMVFEQWRLLFAHFPIRALKTGMLTSAGIVRMVGGRLGELSPASRPAVVVDPVMVATSGDQLVAAEAVDAYWECLFPFARLITPNVDEMRVLTGRQVESIEELKAAGEWLAEKTNTAVLAKGAHLRGTVARDFLVESGCITEFAAPFIDGVHTHGTGCTMSAAITAGLARGLPLDKAVGEAKHYIGNAIAHIFRWNEIDALNHQAAGTVRG